MRGGCLAWPLIRSIKHKSIGRTGSPLCDMRLGQGASTPDETAEYCYRNVVDGCGVAGSLAGNPHMVVGLRAWATSHMGLVVLQNPKPGRAVAATQYIPSMELKAIKLLELWLFEVVGLVEYCINAGWVPLTLVPCPHPKSTFPLKNSRIASTPTPLLMPVSSSHELCTPTNISPVRAVLSTNGAPLWPQYVQQLCISAPISSLSCTSCPSA